MSSRPTGGRGKKFGSAGTSLHSANSGGQKYAKTARQGAKGERYLSSAIQADPNARRNYVYESLKIPHSPGEKRYSSDVDFAVASGKTLILIDAKSWASGKSYWTAFGKIWEGFTPSNKTLGRNMALALSRYKDKLPGDHKVIAIAVFVPTSGGRLPTSVRFLRFPGGVRSYLVGDGIRKINRIIKEHEEPSPEIQGLLGRMTRRSAVPGEDL